MISDTAYRELEKAVGPENISQEPAVLDGYARQVLLNEDPSLWIPRPVAVVLPSSTEEVQAVVRACNKHGLKFKAHSTGWGVHTGPGCDGVVQIDLRRMDRILEIDEKNMYAVVEPYVSGGQLQAEAMKRGLNAHLVGAGPSCSLLASATSMQGMGMDALTLSHSDRNVLGVEWVLPDGEVLKLGTPGSGRGWFLGDGPGPSLRGVMRGANGAMGGLGVFTKCAVKLFPWPGPPVVKTRGLVIDAMSEVPENIKIYMCQFPDKQRLMEATYKLGDAEVGYFNIKVSPAAFLMLLCPRLFRQLLSAKAIRSLFSETLRHGIMYLLATNSSGEMEFQEKTFKKIVSDYHGVLLDISTSRSISSFLVLNMLRSTVIPLIFRYSGIFTSYIGGDDAWSAQLDWSEKGEEVKKKWIEKGSMMLDDMHSYPFLVQYEHNTWSHCEEIFVYESRNREKMKHFPKINLDFVLTIAERCMEPANNIIAPPVRALMSPLEGNFNHWQKAISSALDPNRSADSTFYIGEENVDTSKLDAETRERIEKLMAGKKWM